MDIIIKLIKLISPSQLHKTKAALLRRWLLENGVRCRSKEKKEEIVRMAALHLKQTGKTFSTLA